MLSSEKGTGCWAGKPYKCPPFPFITLLSIAHCLWFWKVAHIRFPLKSLPKKIPQKGSHKKFSQKVPHQRVYLRSYPSKISPKDSSQKFPYRCFPSKDFPRGFPQKFPSESSPQNISPEVCPQKFPQKFLLKRSAAEGFLQKVLHGILPSRASFHKLPLKSFSWKFSLRRFPKEGHPWKVSLMGCMIEMVLLSVADSFNLSGLELPSHNLAWRMIFPCLEKAFPPGLNISLWEW